MDQIVRLLCVANDRPIKGLGVLLDALEHHTASFNWQLDIVGQCGDKIRQQITSSPKLSKHVVAHGFRSDVPEFFRAAHIYIQPTLWPGEGIGNSMAEAMSFGLPVITSNVGGGIELTVNEQTGVHFEVGNASSLGAAIDQLMQAPELCDRMGLSAAASLHARFGLNHEANAFVSLFQRLIDHRAIS
jgi:glycosyltransferase involved in cell wall biosynthesis